MEITLATVADYALVDQAGKMSVVGIFDVLGAAKFPTLHPRMFVCLRIAFRPIEVGTRHKVTVELQGPDGQRIMPGVSGEFVVAASPVPGGPIHQQLVLGFDGIQFAQGGSYSFEIMIDDQHKRSIPLTVTQLQMAPSQ